MESERPMPSALGRGLADQEWPPVNLLDDMGDIYYEPLFEDASTAYAISGFGSLPLEHTTSEHPLPRRPTTSEPASLFEGPPSFDYTLSHPPSIAEDPPSFELGLSWLSSSPSFSTTATSPLIGRQDFTRYGSFDAAEDALYAEQRAPHSPWLEAGETLLNHKTTDLWQDDSQNIFNPFVQGTSHAFNSLDVSSSQAISHVGGQFHAFEQNPELEHTNAIPIPQQNRAHSHQDAGSHSSFRSDLPPPITIPHPNRLVSTNGFQDNSSPWTATVPPIPSISPSTNRRPLHSAPMSRSTSLRRSRHSLPSPSPTSGALGWVSYQPSQHDNRLVPSAPDGSVGKRQRGRTKGLTADQRKNAALMRLIGACSNCRRRKSVCDPGTPCRSCLEHYKGNLIHSPCRERLISNLSAAFLAERLGWHPTARPMASFLPPGGFKVADSITYKIPLYFGFGPALYLPVVAIQNSEMTPIYHEHVVYPWPPKDSSREDVTNVVLPAMLTPNATSGLLNKLDTHLSDLVFHHFRSFPLYTSPLRILREVYIYFLSLPRDDRNQRLLRQALKLLVLVHIGGDLSLPPPSSDPTLAQLVRTSIPFGCTEYPSDLSWQPCLIRAQCGAIMPKLGSSLMNEVLSSLEQILLNRECNEWPIALAVLIVVLMTIESIHYHDAKLPYHHHFDSSPLPNEQETTAARKTDDQNVESLLNFYSACFAGCHARLRPDWEGETGHDTFIEGVRAAVKKASAGGYLERKAVEERVGEDMAYFFDRLVAKLLMLKA